MAFRFGIGKSALKGFGFSKWGVSGSLFAAFAVIAGMAIVISAGAGMVLGHLGETMVELSGRDIPRLAASLQLSAQSASLASQGPALLASRNEETLSERAKKIKEIQTIVVAKLAEVAMLGADKAKLDSLVAGELSYGHSGGVVQDKADFVGVIASKKTIYKSIELSKQTVAVVGNNAIVRHAWESESGTGDGKWNVSKIGILQVWQKQGADWKLLARQAYKV